MISEFNENKLKKTAKAKYSDITGLGYITADSSGRKNLNLAEEYGIASVVSKE